MKKISFSAFTLGVIMCFVACQQDLDDFGESLSLTTNEKDISGIQTRDLNETVPQFMPLDSVPKWVRQKITPKEYQLWKLLSTRYEIDYSILNFDLNVQQKTVLYENLESLCQEIENNSDGESLGYLLIQSLSQSYPIVNRIERLNSPEGGTDIHRTAGPITIYSVNGFDACVKVTVSYSINSTMTEITSASANAYASGKAAIDYRGSHTASPGKTGIVISCSGTLTYRNTVGAQVSSDFSRNTTIHIID